LGKQKTELKYKNKDEISNLIKKLTDENDKMNWFAVSYTSDSFDTLEVYNQGENGIEEFKKILIEDKMIFIVFSLKWSRNYVKDIENLSKTFFGMVQWNGKKISVLEKALNSHHFNDFSSFIKSKMDTINYNISGGHLHTDDIEEITYDRLIKVMCLYD
jgi:hypothetical protein